MKTGGLFVCTLSNGAFPTSLGFGKGVVNHGIDVS